MNTSKDNMQKKLNKLCITCWTHNPDIGNNRTLAVFEDGHDCLDQQPALSKALDWLDDLLDATKNFSLMFALNEIQAECNLDKDPPPFPNKHTMPLCIVNLVLKEHGLEIEEY